MDTMALFTNTAGFQTYIWPFVHTKGGYIAIAVIYGCIFWPIIMNASAHFELCGFSSGAFVSFIAAPIVALGDVDDVGRCTGMYFSILAIGALAGPPSKLLSSLTRSRNFLANNSRSTVRSSLLRKVIRLSKFK